MSRINENSPDRRPEKGDTNPFGVPAYRPKRRFALWLFFSFSILGILFFLVIRSSKPAEKSRLKTEKAPEKGPIWIQMKVNEIGVLEALAYQEKKQLVTDFEKWPQRKQIREQGWDYLQPPADLLEKLRQLANKGDDTVANYLYRLDSYKYLRKRIGELENELGLPHLVMPGDTHFRIALDFLTKRIGKSENESRRILQSIHLREPLIPGFKVWNFWLDGNFLTFVTMGAAHVQPETATRKAMEKEIAKKKQALNRLHSLYLLVDTYKGLQERKILQGGFFRSLRLGNVDPSDFRLVIDLSRQRRITIRAANLKLNKISKLELFPGDFHEGKDYSLEFAPDQSLVRIDFQNTEVFRGRRVVIAVQ